MSKFIVNYNKKIKERKCEYGDLRDWFYLEEDVPKPHNTKLFILINDSEQIDCGMIPINFASIEIKMSLIMKEYMDIFHARVLIPEMGLKSKDILDHVASADEGDTIILTFNFNMEHEE